MATPDLTLDRGNGHGTDSAGEMRPTRRPIRYAEVHPDAVAMGTRSRRTQAYSTALAHTAELMPYYSAFGAAFSMLIIKNLRGCCAKLILHKTQHRNFLVGPRIRI